LEEPLISNKKVLSINKTLFDNKIYIKEIQIDYGLNNSNPELNKNNNGEFSKVIINELEETKTT